MAVHEGWTASRISVDGALNLCRAVWDVLALYVLGFIEVMRQIMHRHTEPRGLHVNAGDVAVVTGGAEGIGLHVARRLALLGMRVFIAGPHSKCGQQAVASIKESVPGAYVQFLELDLASLQCIQEFVDKFLAYNTPLHVLVNNAGVMLTPLGPKGTLDRQLAINYVGHFFLTRLLLGRLALSGCRERQARIVNLSSAAHCLGDARRVLADRWCSSHSCYCDSKLAIVMTAYWLDRLLRSKGLHVSVSCVHPGVVASRLYQNVWAPLRLVQSTIFAPLLLKTPDQGAATVVQAASSVHVEGASGLYYDNCQPVRSSRQSYNVTLQEALWTKVCHLVGLSVDLS